MIWSQLDYEIYIDFNIHKWRFCSFFVELLDTCFELRVKQGDRMAIINICLGFDCEVDSSDINCAFVLYGFNEEVEALIYATNRSINFGNDPYDDDSYNYYSPLLCFIPGTRENPKIGTLMRMYNKHLLYNMCKAEQKRLIDSLLFFSIPHNRKQQLLNSQLQSPERYQDISWVLEALPGIPSVIELSRNHARVYIRSCYQVDKPYQFHSAVKVLNLPQHIKDVIRFKTPLYL